MQNEVTIRFVRCHNHLRDSGAVVSTRQFALRIDAHPQSINEVLKGRRDATVKMLTKVVREFNVSPSYLIAGIGSVDDTIQTPREDNITYVPIQAQAGYVDQFLNDEHIEAEKFSIPGYNARGENRCFDVSGDSMEPTLNNGDKIVCSEVPSSHMYNAIKDKHVYVIVTENEVLVKRVINELSTNGYLTLLSDNNFYSPIVLDGNELREVWEVKTKISPYSSDPNNIRNSFHSQIELLQNQMKMQQEHINQLNKSIETLLRKNRN